MRLISLIAKVLDLFIVRPIRKLVLRRHVKWIHGPMKIDQALDELVILCLIRDGEKYIKPFIEHYFKLGAKHIVFLDNNSTDKAIDTAKTYSNITIMQTNLPYKKYHFLMKQYLIERFSRQKWSLSVDIDEFFDYPFSDTLRLCDLLRYFNQKSFTAVVAQMLDLFADSPVAHQMDEKTPFRSSCRYYDISQITKVDYYVKNKVSNRAIKLYFGGIRKILFGLDGVYLTKHPLIFGDGNIKPMCGNAHEARRAYVADVSCVLYHYKFFGTFYQQIARAVKEENYFNNSLEYKSYQRVLTQTPDLPMKQETSLKLGNVNELIQNNFLVVSQDFKKWVEEQRAS